ncbi:uncharacterized protein TM35_000281200 [Trypanosoma theileri]|uniref:Uncharacterized protein n=1 Tax=Trypanosoma theileri TaxID=67003 RepID=A0A1X0NNW9_9TRYP|nr:uncharacterized protein TM35_000281200 [Trypanosoma theileri]ORC86404.1 hypothetical protein TM35_000281200 [Trypanosoma theileri]
MKRKRPIEEEEKENRGQYAAYLCSGSWCALVPLYRPLTADVVDGDVFPGIAFFFLPHVIGMKDDRYLLALSEGETPCDSLIKRRPWQPCSLHGPFRCSCFILEQLARNVFQLEQELMMLRVRIEVVVDEKKDNQEDMIPFLKVNTKERTVFLYLCGLPLPQRCYGPFNLYEVDDVMSIGHAITSALKGAQLMIKDFPKCVLCAIKTEDTCSVCQCVVCNNCGVLCLSCGKKACTACVVVVNTEALSEEDVCCFSCYNL